MCYLHIAKDKPTSLLETVCLSGCRFSQEHLPYADDSNAVTPMSEENGAIVVPMYYANLGSRHSSYTSHASRLSYTSHADLLSGPRAPTKESRLRSRSSRNSTSTVTHQPYSDKPYKDFVSTVVNILFVQFGIDNILY